MTDQPEKTPAATTTAGDDTTTAAQANPSATLSTPTTPPGQAELIPAQDPEDDEEDGDADSALGSDAWDPLPLSSRTPSTNTIADSEHNSTASVTASILEYRTIQGRTYHSDRHSTEYFTPNDEQQLQSVDITHHYLTILLDNSLFLAPISSDVPRVLDVGTGSGIWAIDFADQFPNAEVIGSDLSPCQPDWVPPNVKFEIDDATLTWTWKDGYFDFIHIRYLFGAIQDWTALFKEAYRCCAPGGWVQSCEADVHFYSDDGTTDSEPVLKTWARLYEDGGKAMGRPFFVQQHGLQEKGIAEAGFTDIKVVDYKLPVGGWPKDPKLSEIGQFVKLTLENDLEGYTLLLWHNVLDWPKNDYQLFLMAMRKVLRNRKIHAYMVIRYVYARKPEAA